MWTESYTHVFTNLEKEKVWKLWTDIDNWHKWNPAIESAKLEGNFEIGQAFTLKVKNGPSVKLKIVEVIENEKFTDCTNFPGAEMFGIHEMFEEPDGLRLTTTMKVTGIASRLWQNVAEEIMKKVPQQTEALAKLAQS